MSTSTATITNSKHTYLSLTQAWYILTRNPYHNTKNKGILFYNNNKKNPLGIFVIQFFLCYPQPANTAVRFMKLFQSNI